jgi:hypothetical protein
MHAGIEFRPQNMIDRAMALDQALALKGFRNYFDLKVGSPRARGRAWPLHGMSVARVLARFIDDFDGTGGKGGPQFRLDAIAGGNVALLVHLKTALKTLTAPKPAALLSFYRIERLAVTPKTYIMPEL